MSRRKEANKNAIKLIDSQLRLLRKKPMDDTIRERIKRFEDERSKYTKTNKT